jgi:formylglycine-generating enzyme required for sulfatase activity
LAYACLLIASFSASLASQSRGLAVRGKDGAELGGFAASYALVVGESQYSEGWPKLAGASDDAVLVAQALEEAGFLVSLKQNLDFEQLRQAYEDFIDSYGLDESNRLIFYYAGHGQTLKLAGGRDMGYIVPIDAPNPNSDLIGYKKKSIPMQQFDTWAKRIESRHALFLFDSCFSGSIFNVTRAVPENISDKTVKAVRQFITSGSAEEPVPDRSIFREQFIAGIKGDADRNDDGYVTGAELGEYLNEKVVNYSNKAQHPQYGKIQDPRLDKGDFVFALPAKAVVAPPPAVAPAAAPGGAPAQAALAPTMTILKSYGGLSVSAAEGGSLFLDGVKLGDIPAGAKAALGNIEAGERSVEIRYADGSIERKSVIVPADQAANVAFSYRKAAPAQGQPAASPPPVPAGFISVPGGSFQMGSKKAGDAASKDELQHKVSMSPFSLSAFDVTVGDFSAFVEASGYKTSADLLKNSRSWSRPGFPQGAKNPVVCVSWYDAVAYCNWRSLREGRAPAYSLGGQSDFARWPAGWNTKTHNDIACDFAVAGYRLPTEAEWEFAAREGAVSSAEKLARASIASFDGEAWHNGNSGDSTQPVGQKRPNALGLFDMLGNAWQWCQDWYAEYPPSAQRDPRGPVSGTNRVLRGGSWSSSEDMLRPTARSFFDPWFSGSSRGFRLASSASGK